MLDGTKVVCRRAIVGAGARGTNSTANVGTVVETVAVNVLNKAVQ